MKLLWGMLVLQLACVGTASALNDGAAKTFTLGIGVHPLVQAGDHFIFQYSQQLLTSVEGASPPIDQFGSVRRVYPLPAKDLVKVEALGPGTGAASIRIVQPNGRVAREFHFSGLAPSQYQTLQIDVAGLPSGIYLLWYSDSTERGIKAGRKLVVLK